MQYTADNLVVHPSSNPSDASLLVHVTPESAGWDHIYFEVRHLRPGDTLIRSTGDFEYGFVNLTGVYAIHSSHGDWRMGGRRNVFEGPAHVLYLPRNSKVTLVCEVEGDIAITWAAASEDHAALFIEPGDVPISVRGGDNVSRQINDLLPPGSPVERLVLVEVYTPSGNWSSYPPHKHDRHLVDDSGAIVEADLEEVYYYKIDKPDGYAYQRVYTDETSPGHAAGNPIDAVVIARDGDVVLIPEGYHPVTSAPGFTTYYLNVLAGSAQSLANQDDPRYTWVKQQYKTVDPRLPLY